MREGFPRSMYDGPLNLVGVPTFKHWEINRWFETKQDRYGGLTPREYLKGKSWEEKFRVGLIALIENGILEL